MKTLPPGVTEAQTLTDDVEVGCDVCIVGSGPGGAVTAAVLAEAGLRVVVVEEGGYFTKARFRQREDEAYPYLYQDGAQRTTKDLAITVMQGKAVGGGSVVNWTTCFRTPSEVLDLWKLKHEVGGVDGQNLDAHFGWAEKRLSVTKTPIELVNANNRTIYDGCQTLRHDVDTTSRNVLGCAQTGNCGHGCPIDAKQSMLVTCIPDAIKAGASVVSRCRVDHVQFEGSRAVAVVGRAIDAFGLSDTGVTITIKPRVVVVSRCSYAPRLPTPTTAWAGAPSCTPSSSAWRSLIAPSRAGAALPRAWPAITTPTVTTRSAGSWRLAPFTPCCRPRPFRALAATTATACST